MVSNIKESIFQPDTSLIIPAPTSIAKAATLPLKVSIEILHFGNLLNMLSI